jgi:hypothetical protein
VKKPRRRYEITLLVSADDAQGLEDAFRDVIASLGEGRLGAGPFCTASPGHTYQGALVEDPTMTPDRYRKELSAYLDTLPGPGRNESRRRGCIG